MNINKAFHQGRLNFTLYNLITEKLTFSTIFFPFLHHFFIQGRLLNISLSINFGGLCFLAFSSFQTFENWLGLHMIFLILTLCFATLFFVGFLYGTIQNWRFERLYKEFICHLDIHPCSIGYCASFNEKVHKRLKELASSFERVEKKNGKMSPYATLARKKLSDAHAFFLESNLCEPHWNIYFEKTEKVPEVE